jgi:hypothetical protein
MSWLLGALFLAHIVFAVNVKTLSSAGTLQGDYPTQAPPSTPQYQQPRDDDDDDDDDGDNTESNGYRKLSSLKKKLVERCVIDPFLKAERECGNNPYSALTRLSFHDCGTFDSTDTNPATRGGCHAWMSKKKGCDEIDECEYTNQDNNGLQKWVDALDKIYNNAQVNGKDLDKILSRADFWHLAAHRAIIKTADGNIDMIYQGGRSDPKQEKPHFPNRLPQAFGWSEMQRVAKRNGMSDVSAAALIGAHTLGGCHPQTSGYQGTWDPTPFTFDSEFWKALLLDGQWFTHHITAVNDQTGDTTEKDQFSLGGDNFDSSVMLFSDMGSHMDLSTCNVQKDEVASGACQPNNNPSALQNILRAWRDTPSTFFSAFERAYTAMSRWDCPDCYNVTNYDLPVLCLSTYQHTCKFYKSTGYKPWKQGWDKPSTAPPATQYPGTPAPTQYPGTPAPTPTPTSGYTSRTPAPTQYSGDNRTPSPTPSPTPTVRRYYLEKNE